jgi:alkylhydroperoxidase family enzyme
VANVSLPPRTRIWASLEWTEAVTLVAQSRVPDRAWEVVKPHFSEQEISDLTLLIVAINS